MAGSAGSRSSFPQTGRLPGATYRTLFRHVVVRLVAVYFVPLLLLTVFFHIQYRLVARDAERQHQRALAEHQAAMLDVFLGDRLLNLTGLTDDPAALLSPQDTELAGSLAQLHLASDAFIDLAVLDDTGRVLAYAGPLPELAGRSYQDEVWFVRLLAGSARHVITDTYLGFRGEPHYTMALKLEPRGTTRILRAAISPVVTAVPPATDFTAEVGEASGGVLPGIATNLWLVTAIFGGCGGLLVLLLARWVARQQFAALQKEEELKRQLVHAARLATVGEITAGIAHEVNNPLAVVAEKAGLIKDLLDPRFGRELTAENLSGHLDAIVAAAFRATSITQRLLGFVRADEVRLQPCSLNEALDEVVDVMLGAVLRDAEVTVRRDYDLTPGEVVTDRDRFQQVVLNLVKNAVDAMTGPGEIGLRTRRGADFFVVAVADTGRGMTAAELDRVFMPFFTTKPPGAGTGLGLSVSYGLVTGLGGRLSVSSTPGDGSVFTIELPLGR